MPVLLSYISLLGIALFLAAIGVLISFIGEKTCMSKQCLGQAEFIHSSMDKDISPCDNFYSFVCRKFPKFKSTIIDDIEMTSLKLLVSYLKVPSDWEKDGRIKHIAKSLYQNCINDTQLLNEGLTPLKRIISEIGGIPFLDPFWDDAKKSGFDVIFGEVQHFIQGLNSVFIYTRAIKMKTYPSVYPKPAKNQMYCGYSVPPNLYKAVAPDPENYLKYCVETSNLFSKMLSTNKTITDRDTREIKEAATFKRELLRIIDKTKNCSEQPYKFVRALEFDYDHYFGANYTLNTKEDSSLYRLCIRKGEPESTVLDYVVVTPKFEKYFNDLQKLLLDTPMRVLATYMGVEGLIQMIPFLPLPFRNIYKKYLQSEQDKQNKVLSNRQVHCAKLINDAMTTALTTEYLKDNKEPPKGLKALHNVANELLNSVREILKQITWASKIDQSEMLRLVNRMKIVSPLPPDVLEKLLNRDQFQDFYLTICMTEDSTLQSYLSVRSLKQKKNGQLISGREFIVYNEDYNIFDTQIFYQQHNNTIVVPMAFLSYPSLDELWPKYLSFGGLAVWIAREVIKTVGYDNVLYPELKVDRPLKQEWWAEETVSGYEKERRCALYEYNNYLGQFDHMTNSDANCLEETLYNAAAVQAAYYAYKENTKMRFFVEPKIPYMKEYTVDQIFFIKYASSFCQYEGPGFKYYSNKSDSTRVSTNFKVLYGLRNFPEFIQAFKCQGNDKMNKEKPCKIWKTVTNK